MPSIAGVAVVALMAGCAAPPEAPLPSPVLDALAADLGLVVAPVNGTWTPGIDNWTYIPVNATPGGSVAVLELAIPPEAIDSLLGLRFAWFAAVPLVRASDAPGVSEWGVVSLYDQPLYVLGFPLTFSGTLNPRWLIVDPSSPSVPPQVVAPNVELRTSSFLLGSGVDQVNVTVLSRSEPPVDFAVAIKFVKPGTEYADWSASHPATQSRPNLTMPLSTERRSGFTYGVAIGNESLALTTESTTVSVTPSVSPLPTELRRTLSIGVSSPVERGWVETSGTFDLDVAQAADWAATGTLHGTPLNRGGQYAALPASATGRGPPSFSVLARGAGESTVSFGAEVLGPGEISYAFQFLDVAGEAG